jgi:hypothetical protein
MDMRHLEFAEGSFDGLWSSIRLLHIREKDTERTLSGFKSVLRGRGLFFAGLHRGPNTDWVKRPISGMERVTYVQEWAQSDIESVVRAAGFFAQSEAFPRLEFKKAFLRTCTGVVA